MRSKIGSLRLAAAAVFGFALAACSIMPGWADVRLPAIESDNMVLQAGNDSQLFGSATAGEEIRITYGGRHAATTADTSGHWHVRLEKLKPGETFDIIVAGKNAVTIKNVLVGQVWLCSGQSNMEFELLQANNHEHEIATANHEQIRLFKVKHHISVQPVEEVDGSWSVCSPETAGPFSAVGYFFGRALNQDLKEPVGLIESAWGGTPAQTWTSLDGLQMDPVTQKRYWIMAKANLFRLQEISDKYDKDKAAWTSAEENNPDKPRGKEPYKPMELTFPAAPAALYNGMIAPLTRFTIGGVIWYQGESNAYAEDETMAYRSLFPALTKDWRKKFARPELPFLFVQLANYKEHEDANERSPWAELREAQMLSLSVPHTGMAVAVDIGDEKNIHPNNKQDVGKRLELIALDQVYGKPVVFSGPIFKQLQIKGDQAICSFTHTEKGLKTREGGAKVPGFIICGEDKKFFPADAVISGDTVVVSSDKVKAPVAVRYAWQGDPANDLYNGAGLPASPFRSDVTPEHPVVKLPLTK